MILAICVLIVIAVLWYVRRRRDATGGGGTDCEAQQYKQVPMNEYTQEPASQQTVATHSPIIKNQETVKTEEAPKQVEKQTETKPVEQQTEAPKED